MTTVDDVVDRARRGDRITIVRGAQGKQAIMISPWWSLGLFRGRIDLGPDDVARVKLALRSGYARPWGWLPG